MKTFIFWVGIQGILCSFALHSVAAPMAVFEGQDQRRGIYPATAHGVNAPLSEHLVAGLWAPSGAPAGFGESQDGKAKTDLGPAGSLTMDEVRVSALPITGATSLFLTVLLVTGVVARNKFRSHRREAVSA
ncbi:hypothetical protein [Marinobacter salicampi]|uniref:hypothetical protein n=1 Tax=Marinobacter salicampi TaxID=435907 RepID=UPI00140910AD|nr:hypothetical protein [Marinobacter salicampi]